MIINSAFEGMVMTEWYLKISAVIESCLTPKHCEVTGKLITMFENRFGGEDVIELKNKLLDKIFSINLAVNDK